MPGEVVNKKTDSPAFPPVNGPAGVHPGEGKSEAVVIGWGRQGIPRKGAGWVEQHREGMTVSRGDAVDLSTAGYSQRRSSLAVGFVPDQRAGGGGMAVGRLSGPHIESSESRQMRLLLVKRGSALPLYLRLVTDHLRLFTLYEQVG